MAQEQKLETGLKRRSKEPAFLKQQKLQIGLKEKRGPGSAKKLR